MQRTWCVKLLSNRRRRRLAPVASLQLLLAISGAATLLP